MLYCRLQLGLQVCSRSYPATAAAEELLLLLRTLQNINNNNSLHYSTLPSYHTWTRLCYQASGALMSSDHVITGN